MEESMEEGQRRIRRRQGGGYGVDNGLTRR
jgi:hypothetical protein